MANTLDIFSEEIAKLLLPLRVGFSCPAEAEAFLHNLGWRLPPGVQDIGLTRIGVQTLVDKLQIVLNSTPDEKDDTLLMVTRYTDLLAAAGTLIHDISETMQDISNLPGMTQDYLNKTKIHERLLIRLLDYLIIEYFKHYHYSAFSAFVLMGMFKLTEENGKSQDFTTDFIKHEVFYDRLTKIISDPKTLGKDVYGWGTAAFDARAFLMNLALFLESFGALVHLRKMHPRLEELFLNRHVPEAIIDPMPQADITLMKSLDWDGMEVGLSAFGLRPTSPDGTDCGFGISPYARGTTDFVFPLTPQLFFEIATTLDVQGGVALLLRPDKGLEVRSDLLGSEQGATVASGRIFFTLRLGSESGDPVVLLSVPGGSRMESQQIFVSAGASVTENGNMDLVMEAGFRGGKLIFTSGEGDNFLQKILPSEPMEMDFDITVGFSSKSGLYFKGSSALEIRFPTHIEIGPIALERLTIAIKPQEGKIPLTLGADIKATLGPLVVVVQNMGAIATFSFPPNHDGNLGPLQLDLGFKPPNGVGLSIDTGVVKGGGFLRFNFDKGEYFGALELSIKNTINLKAVGIINTKMPDGSPGFALLILITAEFTPIQLGMGFSLMGVGGLLGLNRSTNIEALKTGVRTGAVSSILFPKDVVANITRIISDLTTIFPIVEAHFIIAPMGKVGWFTPPLITLELGIIIDIPSPTLVIIGVLRCVLPEEKSPILKLQVNFAGGIDFDKGIIWFDASLFDSSILVYTLTGDMALRIGWGDNPLFILSVGGFHPAFHEVPPDLTNMTRLTLSLLSGNNPRLIAQTYFAVTSNTVQSGAKVELYAEACGFNVYGFLGYDLLVQLPPLYFIADIYAGLALRSGSDEIAGINVHCELSGPTPWHALGDASLKILFFKVTVGFDHTWGDSALPQTLEAEDVLKLLTDALNDSRNWKTDIPANTSQSVSVKQIDLAPGEIILHPFGVLAVSQKVVPLKLAINKFGNKQPASDTLFDIAYSGGNTAYVEEQFASAQFFQMSDNEKLARKSFENMKSGLRFQGSDSTSHGFEIDKDVTYELIYVHKRKFLSIKAGIIKLFNSVFQVAAKGNATAKSSYSASKRKASNAPAKVDVFRQGYKVVNVSDMEEYAGTVAVATEAEAYDLHDGLIGKNPSLRGSIQVVSNSELN